MGNEMCNNTGGNDDQEKPAPPPIKNIQIDLPKKQCEICREERTVDKIVKHLDLCHLTFIQNKSDGSLEMEAVCLLCDQKLQNLEKQKNHLKYRHPAINSLSRKYSSMDQNQGLQLNRTIKNRVQEIKRQDISLSINDKCLIKGQKMKFVIFSKQYSALQFNPKRYEPDLIWKPIFEQTRDAVYYNIEIQSLMKSVKVTVKIFSKVNPENQAAVREIKS